MDWRFRRAEKEGVAAAGNGDGGRVSAIGRWTGQAGRLTVASERENSNS
jgi:hypothetical protein